MVSRETMNRLRAAAITPTRVAMNRSRMMPTTFGRVQDLEIELERTRQALREAIAIIDICDAEDRDAPG